MSSSDLSGSNTNDGDGCSSLCAIESNYIWSGDSTSSSDSCSACPAGLSPDATKTSCVATCGDSKRASSGTCDDGDTTSGDGCSSSCAIDGDYYIGYYKEGSRNGEGVEYYKNGDMMHEGGWKNDKKYGQGTMYINGDKYIGQWDWNKYKEKLTTRTELNIPVHYAQQDFT